MFNVYADGQSIHFPLDKELIITKPKLTLEMGKAGSFEFSIPPTNRFYSKLQQLKTIITVEYDDVEIFRGRVLTNNRGFNNVRKIYCEGNLAYLVDSVQKGEKYTGTTHALFRRIIANHNSRVEAAKQFTVGNITIDDREIFIAGTSDEIRDIETNKFDYKQIAINSMVDDWNTSFDYIQNTIIDYCGGYLRTRRVGNTTYIDLLKDYGSTSVQTIEFGKNLIDLTEEVKAEDLYTVLIPLGEDNLTIAKVNNGSDELVDTAGVARYGRIVKTNVFDSVNNPETLLENGRRMLANHENMPITITVKAVDMHLVDNSSGRIYVGDRVYIRSIPHDITDYLTCTKIEYDLENHGNDTYTFGNPKQTMTERYKKDKEKKSKSGRGRSGGGGGGGGAAAIAAEEAEDFAVSEAKKTSEEIFDAWIRVDPALGQVSLGGLYKQLESGKEVLKRTAGIDIDAPKGTVDIYAMNSTLDRESGLRQENSAKIQLLSDNQKSLAALTAEWNDKNVSAIAGLSARVTKTESRIETLAKFDTDVSKSLASITQTANDHEARIKSLAQFDTNTFKTLSSITQKVDKNTASISLNAKAIAGNTEKIAAVNIIATKAMSAIELKADLVTVNAKIVDAKDTLRAEFNKIVANKIEAGFVSTGTIKSAILWATNYVRANSLTVEGNIECNGKIYQNRKAVATEEWVKSWVNDRLKNYASSTHKHTVGIGHTHTVKVNTTTYSTSNIASGTAVIRTTSAPA